jgi:hypothetical protein
MGWVVVSLVDELNHWYGLSNRNNRVLNFLNLDSGIVTALVAFLVIRIEAFLFDLKSGICTSDLWRMRNEEACPAGGWKEWGTFNSGWTNWLRGLYGGQHLEALVYFCIAVSLKLSKAHNCLY